MLDPNRLRLLVALSEHGTISAVADELRYAPSTVSHALAALEAEVGVALLERTARSVRLTPAGRALVADAREILSRLESARLEALAVGGVQRAEVVVATFASAAATLVGPAFRALRDSQPGMRLRAVQAEPDEALAALHAGDVDVAVTYSLAGPPSDDPRRDAELLFEEPMLACVPADFDAPRGELDVARLRDVPLAAGRAGSPCEDFTREACRRAGFEPDIAYETDDIAFVAGLVDAGLAVSILPRSLIGCAPVPVRTLPVDAVPPRLVHAVRRRSSAAQAAPATVLAALREVAALVSGRGAAAAGR